MFNPNQDSPFDQNNVQFYAGYTKYLNFLVTNPHGMFVRREWDPRKKMQMDYFYDVEFFGNCYTIMLNYTYDRDENGWFIRMGQNVVSKNGHPRSK